MLALSSFPLVAGTRRIWRPLNKAVADLVKSADLENVSEAAPLAL